MRVGIGDRVFVPKEIKPYHVRARDDRYIICTKPFNLKRTVLYFIVDLEKKWRAPDDRIFCFGYETAEQCQNRLKDLQSGRIELSIRRGLHLDIDIT